MQVITVPSVAVLAIELFTGFRRRSYQHWHTFWRSGRVGTNRL